MNCNIITDNKGNITDVKAPNGASSLLYKAALTFTNNNQNQALDIWAVSQTPSFIEEVLSPLKNKIKVAPPQQSFLEVSQQQIQKNTKKEVEKVATASLKTETGQTFNIDGTVYSEGGLVVPIISENLTQEELTPKRIADFISKNQYKIGSNAVKVGIYKFPNSKNVSIDLNIVAPVENRAAALEFGKIAGQESLFDLNTFENIKTGADGTTPRTFTDKQFRDIAQALSTGLFVTPTIENQLTEDGQGNFVFNHFSQERRDTIKKGTGENIITARDESAALSAVGGLAMYYTMDAQTESGVGNVRHTVLIPKERVYDTDTDPLGFEAEARQRFNEARPGQGFNSNYRTAFITQVAVDNGFEMTVSRWRNNELRAQTTKELTPAEESVNFKERPLPVFKAGDRAIISGVEATVTAVNGQRVSYRTLDGKSSGEVINNEMNRRSITKIEPTPTQTQPSSKVKGYNQISKGGATIHFKDGVIELIETAPESRGQGAARALLQNFVQTADQNKQILKLMVAPREKGTTESGLVALYKSVGFSFDRGSDFEMTRYPKRTAPSLLDQNGEPRLQQILYYIEQSNAEGTPSMTQVEKQTVENILRGLKLTSSNELLQELNKIFPNGQLSKDALDNSPIFTRGEVQRMTQENIDNLLTLKRQLNEEAEIVDNIDFNPEFVFTTNNKNKYGKTETTNPLIIEKEIAAQVAGIQDRAEFDRAFTNLDYTSVVEQYLENEAFAQEMYIRFSTMKQLPKVNMVEGQLSDQIESNKATEIEHVLSFQNVDFRDDVRGLLMVTEDIWDNSPQEIETILRSIEKKGIKAGIDLVGLTAAYENKTKSDIIGFLSALNNVNAVQSQESLEAFIAAYKDFFQVEDIQAVEVVEIPPHHSNKTLVYVENELSEYSMFNDYSLVKVDNNIYQRVNKVSNENLVEILYVNAITENNRVLPNSAYFKNGQVNNSALVDPNNKQQIIQNIQKFAEDNITALNIEESNIDTDVAQQLLLYKYYYNNPINTPVENNLQRDLFMLKDFDGDYTYLSTDFLHDFQVKKLQEQNKNSEAFQKVYNNFFINEKGLQLKNTDVISIRDLQKNITLLSEQEQSNLKNYAAISKDASIKELFTPQAFLFTDTYRKLERDYYQNNPKALPLFKGDYTNIDGETILSKTATSDFLRIKNRLFEKADGNSSDTYYRAIPIKDGNFYDLSEQNLPAKVENKTPVYATETQVSHNKLYSRAEESTINQTNFDCQ